MTTWKKLNESGRAHAVDRKGSAYYITLCNVALTASDAQDAQSGDERCQECEELQKQR